MIRLFALGLVCAILIGCGFQLRSEADLPAGMQRVRVTGIDAVTPLGRDLRKALARSGAQLVADDDSDSAVLNITANRLSNAFHTDVLSVGGNARATEYTLRYHVAFNVLDAQGQALMPAQVIELTRVFTFDASQALGIAAEQDLLTQELQRDMVQAVMRRLEALGNQRPAH